MSALADQLMDFWTWQTPVSFFAGVGVHHIYVKYWRDRKDEQTNVND